MLNKTNKMYITQHCAALKLKAAQRYNIAPEKCHIGHLLLEGMLERPNALSQIDATTDKSETNLSVAWRCMRLASAMRRYGLQPGDSVIIMGLNNLDVSIPFYAGHFNGQSVCGMDPNILPSDLESLFPNIKPKLVFCQQACVEKVRNAFMASNLKGGIVTFDGKNNNLEFFIRENRGTEVNYRPGDFDHHETNAWLILTSGTTGLPKVAMIPYDTVLNGICCWWQTFPHRFERALIMATMHWISSYIYFTSGPLRSFTRVQSSEPLTVPGLISIINNYKPNVTAWTPFFINQFIPAAEKGLCDLSCFIGITIGGGRMEKPLLDRLKKYCPAYMHLAYGMTELLVPIFNYNEDVPVNSVGLPQDKYQYRLIDDNGNIIDDTNTSGELWVKGDDFFKGYLNNQKETKNMLTDDGWLMTGDIFYRDEQDHYFFVERKRLLIRYCRYWIPPLQMEEVMKRHPGVQEACVVGAPDPDCMEVPIGVIQRRNGHEVKPEEINALIRESLPEYMQLSGGLFFIDSFPATASGKINRSKLREIAVNNTTIIKPKLTTQRQLSV